MKNRTDLLLEYIELYGSFDFREDIQIALERDYVANPGRYNLNVLKRASLVMFVCPDATPDYLFHILFGNLMPMAPTALPDNFLEPPEA